MNDWCVYIGIQKQSIKLIDCFFHGLNHFVWKWKNIIRLMIESNWFWWIWWNAIYYIDDVNYDKSIV